MKLFQPKYVIICWSEKYMNLHSKTRLYVSLKENRVSLEKQRGYFSGSTTFSLEDLNFLSTMVGIENMKSELYTLGVYRIHWFFWLKYDKHQTFALMNPLFVNTLTSIDDI